MFSNAIVLIYMGSFMFMLLRSMNITYQLETSKTHISNVMS